MFWRPEAVAPAYKPANKLGRNLGSTFYFLNSPDWPAGTINSVVWYGMDEVISALIKRLFEI